MGLDLLKTFEVNIFQQMYSFLYNFFSGDCLSLRVNPALIHVFKNDNFLDRILLVSELCNSSP